MDNHSALVAIVGGALGAIFGGFLPKLIEAYVQGKNRKEDKSLQTAKQELDSETAFRRDVLEENRELRDRSMKILEERVKEFEIRLEIVNKENQALRERLFNSELKLAFYETQEKNKNK
jgi:hypothetical protein